MRTSCPGSVGVVQAGGTRRHTRRRTAQPSETHQEAVRVGTSASPVYGGTGGELRTFGGRARYGLPGTDRRATVGAQTVSLYRVLDRKAQDFRNVPTSDTEALRRALTEGP